MPLKENIEKARATVHIDSITRSENYYSLVIDIQKIHSIIVN